MSLHVKRTTESLCVGPLPSADGGKGFDIESVGREALKGVEVVRSITRS
jgi:hypothetical protein